MGQKATSAIAQSIGERSETQETVGRNLGYL